MTAVALPTPAPPRPAPAQASAAVVAPQVRRLLESSAAYQGMAPDEQADLARKMVKVASYLATPEGMDVRDPAVALAKTNPVDDAKKRASEDRGFAGQDFEAGAVRSGVEQFGELVQKVDFPRFVSGLIDGVFQAIVDASIKQMRAYGELVANVAKTVDQFAQDNITSNNARDFLTERFPDLLEIQETEQAGSFAEGDEPPPVAPVVAVKSSIEDPQAALQRISTEIGLAKAVTDLTNPEQESELVRQAQLQIARQRQQMLASMVMMGINRIVVTDGLINAKVVFDMRASDQAARQQKASLHDRESSSVAAQASQYGFFGWGAGGGSVSTRSDHVTTVQSSVEDTSESKAEVKARLSGEVRVNFKSDYFPMEKMASPQMIAAIQGNATPPEKHVEGA
jgi:hypothetical protein